MKKEWAKRLIILLLSSFIGIVANPEMLTASDSVAISGIDNAHIVETVILPEPAEEIVTVSELVQPVNNIQSTGYVQSTPVIVSPVVAQTPIVPANNIKIAGKTLELDATSDTANDSGTKVLKYGSKFLYGHNSANVFGILYNVSLGETFTITENDVVTEYVVKEVVIFEKIDDYTLSENGKNLKMSAVARARHNGVAHDLSLMTCYGTSYGNGDASHRLVLFADKI